MSAATLLKWVGCVVLLGWGAAAHALDQPSYLGPKAKRPAMRVATLAPSLTEMVLELGAKDRLVGVSRFDDSPEVESLPRLGGFIDPSIEGVVSLKPDLVLVQPAPGNRAPVEKMAELGVPVLALPMQSMAQTLAAIREVGRALELSDRAEALVSKIEATRAQIRARTRGKKPLRVLFVYGFSPLVVAGVGSFAAELLSDAGAVNAASAAQTAYSVYSVESAVRDSPQVVIDASDTSIGKEKLALLPGLKEARWVKVHSAALMHPGPRLAQGLVELHALLYPQKAADAPP